MKNYTVDIRLLPDNSIKRKGEMIPKWITIHEVSLGTMVTPKDRDFSHYWKLVQNDSVVAYHFLIEANYNAKSVIYQFLESNVATCHTGTTEGNMNSIGIERLVNSDTDHERAIKTQARLAATLMEKYNISLENVVPHKFWSGKECPARLLSGFYGGWEHFIKLVNDYYNVKDFVEGIL